MRLEYRDNAFVRPSATGRRQRRMEFRRMVAVVFYHHDLPIVPGIGAHFRKAPADPLEPGQAGSDGDHIDAQFPGDCDRTERIADVVFARDVQAHLVAGIFPRQV